MMMMMMMRVSHNIKAI